MYNFNILSIELILFTGQSKLQIYEQSLGLLNPNYLILSLKVHIKWFDILFST